MKKNYELIYDRLTKNPEKIPVFGGAYHLADDVDFNKVSHGIVQAIENARFFMPNMAPSTVARKYCHLLFIDPALIEVYLGIHFEELDN